MFINLVVKKVHSVDEFGREKTFTLFNNLIVVNIPIQIDFDILSASLEKKSLTAASEMC